GRSILLTDALQPLCNARGKLIPSPIIEAYNQLAMHAGCPDPGYRMELFTTPQDEAAVDAVWEQARFDERAEVVCLNPGAAFGSAKFWPAEYFVKLAQDLHDHRGSRVLVLCGPAESDLARQIESQANRPGVHSLADHAISLGLTKACVNRAQLLITTDSGP